MSILIYIRTRSWPTRDIINERHYKCKALFLVCISRVGEFSMRVNVFLMIIICLRVDASSVIRKQRFLRDEPSSPLPEPQLVVSKHTAFQCTYACLAHGNCSFYSYDKVEKNCSLYGSQPEAPVVAKPQGTGNMFYKGKCMHNVWVFFICDFSFFKVLSCQKFVIFHFYISVITTGQIGSKDEWNIAKNAL